MLDGKGYVKYCRMVPDDTHGKVHEALAEILETQVLQAKERFAERIALDPAKNEPEAVKLVRCISVDNIGQQGKGYNHLTRLALPLPLSHSPIITHPSPIP